MGSIPTLGTIEDYFIMQNIKTWQIPAKTFLLGEYIALIQGPALLVTTAPCFTLSLTKEPALKGIHTQSPAGHWWSQHGARGYGLVWTDPYSGLGGLGASSAQFIGSYYASQYLAEQKTNNETLLCDYLNTSWSGTGLKPSGYDVLAQLHQGCVYINRHNGLMETYSWAFPDLSFILVHSGQKIATHHHLESMRLPDGIHHLSIIVEQGKKALAEGNTNLFIDAINSYQNQLECMQLTTRHSLQLIQLLKKQPEILAAKGCGAMGADVLLLLVPSTEHDKQISKLQQKGLRILATSETLYQPKEHVASSSAVMR